MKMNRRKTGIILLIVFTLLTMISGGMFLHQYMDSKKSSENFEQLEELVDEIPEETEESKEDEVEEELSEEELEALERAQAIEKYGELFKKNNDFMGWISIEGTNVNYPVMQTPHPPDYYLKKNFDKEYSDYGVPYIEETCAMGISNNIVIYGHHMNDGTMFADLVKYYDKDYRDEHALIQFDTISGFGTYEVVAAFKFDTNNETFKYNEFVTMDEESFGEFMKEVHARQAYDTGVDVEYGDQLLTLSTCEYTYKNGRFVIVAKKVE